LTNAKSILQHLRQELRGIYEPQEADSIANWLMEDFFGLRPVDVIADKAPDLQGFDKWNEALPLLRQHMPVQYVLGYGWFAGQRFAVGEGVLIPRPETEQLVRMADDFLGSLATQKPVVVDLCTGTGCIAHSLALRYSQAEVYAIDNSPQALYYAHLNARRLGVKTVICEADVLSDALAELLPLCDVLVSNPPYVRQSEQAQMHARVLDFEPPYALFVADDEPLVFYEAIARTAWQCLKSGGWLGVEINEALGEATAAIFRAKGFADVAVQQDLHGKDRFVVAKKP
jgi:release factor glutamine methyltransferase